MALVEAHNIRVVCDLIELGEYIGLTSIKPTVYVDGFPDVGVIKDYDKVAVSQSKDVNGT